MRIQTASILFLAGLLLSACGVVPRSAQISSRPAADADTSSSEAVPQISAVEEKPEPEEPSATNSVSSLKEVQASLIQAYRDWKGTPYVLGGASQQGVDCSRLVNIVFDDYFGIELPTNTRTQLNVGDGIRRVSIRTGDLVFFKTGRKTLHVGIAVNRGEFLHASTSNGVMISKLGNSYWRNRFLAARRVF